MENEALVLPYVLLGQAVLETLVLFVIVRRVAAREGDGRTGYLFLAAVLTTAAAVAAQYWQADTAGVLAAIPPLVTALILLRHRTWNVLRHALSLVLLFSLTYVALLYALDRVLHPPEPKTGQEEAGGAYDAISFHQVVDQINFAGERQPGPEPEPGPEPSGPKPEPEAPENPVDWAAAMAQLRVGGSMKLEDGREVAIVGGRMLQPGKVVAAEYRDRLYRWRLRAINKTGIDWERLGVIDLRPPEPEKEAAASAMQTDAPVTATNVPSAPTNAVPVSTNAPAAPAPDGGADGVQATGSIRKD